MNKKNFSVIKIAGGGIAGLSAAMYLQRKNFQVEVYEKEKKIGKSRHGDFEGIENWIFSSNNSNAFKKIGFNTDKISLSPVRQFVVHTATDKPFKVKCALPFFNLVKRGSNKGDLDSQLFEQCVKEGIIFNLGQQAPKNCDIIATGTKKASAYISGLNFKTNSKNQIHLLLGSKFAPKGYAYMIIQDGQGTIATAFKKDYESKVNPLKNCIDEFSKLRIDIIDPKKFGSRGSFSLPFGFKYKKPFFVGEAGGFQDYLFGFGMKISMLSGLAAAMFIEDKGPAAKKLFRDLNKKRKISFINRILYERLSDNQMHSFAKRFSESDNSIELLSSAYEWNIKNLIRWSTFKSRYEIRTS